MAWTPQLIMLFSELKHSVTSSPFLTLFGPDKPTFLKTYWISDGMNCILVQPVTDKESHHTVILLKDIGNCLLKLPNQQK